MVELKVQCDCGQRYKFDVEPVNNQMPYAVTCPLCGLDGTRKANALLQQGLTAAPISVVAAAVAPVMAPVGSVSVATPPSLLSSAPAPAPAIAAEAPIPVPAAMASAAAVVSPPDRPRLRITRPSAEEASQPASATTPPPPPPVARPMAGALARPVRTVVSSAAQPARQGNFALGLVGSLIGAILGSVIYYLVFYHTEAHWGPVALLAGFLAGLGGRFLGKAGSKDLGILTATFVVFGVLASQYFVARAWFKEIVDVDPPASYEAHLKEAKEIMAAIPTGSDEEVRTYIASQLSFGNHKTDPATIDADDIKIFKETQLPVYRNLASGQTSKVEFDKMHAAERELEKEIESTFKSVFLLLLLNKVNLFSLAAAAALAFKMTTDAAD